VACSATTSSSILRKFEFCVNVSGVGGSFDVLPMARSRLGGSDGRSDRMWLPGLALSGKVYYIIDTSEHRVAWASEVLLLYGDGLRA
jgi:hypothetical protein